MQGLIVNNSTVKIGQDAELIHASLERLLFAETGCIIGALNKGSRIPDYLGEPGNEATALGIMDEAKTLISVFEPRIVLEAIAIDITPTESTVGVILYLKWHFISNESVSYDTLLSKVFVIS